MIPINELSKKALSNQDLYNLFDHNVKVFKYNELYSFDTINNAFNPFNIMFVLYEYKEDFGHWVVICRDDTTIYFFDPYGLFPDQELRFTDKYRSSLPYLSMLLIKSPLNVVYNKYKLQDIKDNNVATCGRWCALYALLYKNFSMDEFANIFLNNDIKPDDAITLLTNYA